MTCSSCGTANEPGRKFCRECGAALALGCPSCGAPNAAEDKFCGDCGAQLTATPAAGPAPPAPSPPAAPPQAERRVVSVLFADLVGFTAASEQRDAEETRELLSRYFDVARTTIERYGGTVEKFIGDAVMAVWGAPTVQEDDAERAVRTALDLVVAVPELDGSLRLRAGVLTGEAAVTIGAQGEGMVAGDLVNTASRIQSAAEPGTVLVGEATRRATEAAIAYEDAGVHELKGKAQLMPLWQALRVTAGRGGALKSSSLEPPFVGRRRELRLVKELFHAAADERKAQVVSVVGIAGIGKSRLAWEFYKYIDGLQETIYWHRGRCLAYGEGVTYWALAEMVRMRAGIVEGEEPESALEKLRASIAEHVADQEEREWVEPRLAHLLGLEDMTVRDRDDLFAGWRLFFERLADEQPTILVLEDMQWADAALLEFVEHLLEWSRNHPLYVLALARPELSERHPGWAAGKRNFTALHLEPLGAEAMHELLDGLLPGLPSDVRQTIVERAEGVPLYAVETVRMLLDRGLLEADGERYRTAGPIESLDVPETLQALLSARLDGLDPGERRVVQIAAVLGKTFAKPSLVSLADIDDETVDRLLAGLVRKDVLTLQADPRSPERGHYGFVQDLLKLVAYDTLSRGDRKALHLAAARHLEQTWGAVEHEIVEVVASHYVDAYRAVPGADDAEALSDSAREMLERAGERAASLAAGEEAKRYFEQAAELAADPLVRARLHERAGDMAWLAGQGEASQRLYTKAIELLESEGDSRGAARVSARLGDVERRSGRLDEGLARMEAAFAVLEGEEPDEAFAALAAEIARSRFFRGDVDGAEDYTERALEIAEALWLPEVLAQTLITSGLNAMQRGRLEQSLAMTRHGLALAQENDLPQVALRAYNNIGNVLGMRDRYEDAIELQRQGLELAKKVGARLHMWILAAELAFSLFRVGRWDEALETASEVPAEEAVNLGVFVSLPDIFAARGDAAEARRLVDLIASNADSSDVQARATYLMELAAVLRAEGRTTEALAAAAGCVALHEELGSGSELIKQALVEGVEAALELGEQEKAEELLAFVDELRPGELPPSLGAQAARFRARLAALRGDREAVEPGFKSAAGILREFGLRFWLAVTLLEHGEWLAVEGRPDEAAPLVAEARGIFAELRATPWLERAERVAGAAEVVA